MTKNECRITNTLPRLYYQEVHEQKNVQDTDSLSINDLPCVFLLVLGATPFLWQKGSKPFFLSYLLVVYTFGQMECLKSVLLLNGNLKIYWQCQIQNISIMYISCMLNTISCSLNSHWTWGNHTMLMPLLECSGRWHRFTVIRKECDRVVLFKSF